MNKTIVLSILAITLLMLASCAVQQTQPAPTQPTPAAAPQEKMNNGISAGGDTATVKIKEYKFTPADLHIKAGTTVTWVNQDPVQHNIVSDDKTLQSPTLEQGDSWTHTFNTPGTFSYTCGIHPGMKGSVTVE